MTTFFFFQKLSLSCYMLFLQLLSEWYIFYLLKNKIQLSEFEDELALLNNR